VFGAFAWILFFKDKTAADGSRIDGTLVRGNYLTMGAVLAIAAFAMILLCILATRRHAEDSRSLPMEGNNLGAFLHDIGAIFKDRIAWYVFGFFGFAQLAMLLVSQIQMFTYVHYMQFTSIEKTCVHGAGMVSFALGSLSVSRLVGRFDKKPTGYIGIAISMLGGLALFVLFTCGLVEPRQMLNMAGRTIPLAAILFGLFQGMWWGGCGILVPLAVSMIADISAINQHRTGLLKNGSYSAVFSFFLKAAASFGLLITGWLVTWAGIVSGSETQTAEAARNVSVMTFLAGPGIVLFSYFILRKYPVNRAYMEALHSEANGSTLQPLEPPA
jgi:GPH family glycoside/pentoside/hexuronide:cation symporter